MIARWEQGRATIDALIAERRLERVTPSRDLADALLDQAHRHLETAAASVETDPTGSFQLGYDAARKALAAILANQGLRSRGDGAHAVLLTAALAQLDPPMGRDLRHFDWLRRTRNSAEYPIAETPPITATDAGDALPLAKAVVAIAERVIPNMPVY
ncbi:MAG: HEPN domain-containing protein [Actinomycetales bacterium]|nr:HEPN domain-containing protein [Actinomycetales bacterium]